MATLINSLSAIWTRWSPDDLPGVLQENESGVQTLSWGTPIMGQQPQISFEGSYPPIGAVAIGETFSLGQITIENWPVSDGEPLGGITLRLSFEFGGPGGAVTRLDLPLVYTVAALPGQPATLTLTETLPVEAISGDLQLTLFGFEQGGEIAPIMQALEGVVSAAQIVARLDRSPLEHEECTEGFVPVFTPAGCEVADVCALPEGPIIYDCGIPEPPGPLTDCPEIDISAPTLASAAEGYTDRLIAGGLIGAPGCRVVLKAEYYWYWVHNCAHAGVYVFINECPTTTTTPPPDGRPICCYTLTFVFYFCWYPVYYYYACCPAIWCDDDWMPADDYWCDGVTMPNPITVPGRYPGELIHICHCTSTTSTTTTSTTTTSTTTTSTTSTTTTSTTAAPPSSTTTTSTTTTTTPAPTCTVQGFLVCVAAGSETVNLEVIANGTNLGTVVYPATECRSHLWLTDPDVPVDDFLADLISNTPMSCCGDEFFWHDSAPATLYDNGTLNTVEIDDNVTIPSLSGSNVSQITFIAFSLEEVEGVWQICGGIRAVVVTSTYYEPLEFTFY